LTNPTNELLFPL